jgi:hypothetical protein
MLYSGTKLETADTAKGCLHTTAPVPDPTLPRAAVRRPRGLDPERPDRRDDFRGEDRVAVEDQVPRPDREREGLAQLLDDPRRGRMIGDLDM